MVEINIYLGHRMVRGHFFDIAVATSSTYRIFAVFGHLYMLMIDAQTCILVSFLHHLCVSSTLTSK